MFCTIDRLLIFGKRSQGWSCHAGCQHVPHGSDGRPFDDGCLDGWQRRVHWRTTELHRMGLVFRKAPRHQFRPLEGCWLVEEERTRVERSIYPGRQAGIRFDKSDETDGKRLTASLEWNTRAEIDSRRLCPVRKEFSLGMSGVFSPLQKRTGKKCSQSIQNQTRPRPRKCI